MKPLCLALAVVFTVNAFALAQTKEKGSSRILTVRFCDLTSQPEKYQNQLVRTEASFIVWWESSYLYSDACKDAAHKIHNAADCSPGDLQCETRFALEWKKLEPHMRSKQSDVQTTERAKAVFIGRLIGPGDYGHLGSFAYEFRIASVESARPIPKRVSWKGL